MVCYALGDVVFMVFALLASLQFFNCGKTRAWWWSRFKEPPVSESFGEREGGCVGVEATIPRVQERANGNRNGHKEQLGVAACKQMGKGKANPRLSLPWLHSIVGGFKL
jgi:hypothetical protein